MDDLLCIDLFCGYGGWAKGFSDAGYRVIGFDNEIKCKKHYEANGGEFVLADVRNLDGHRFAGAQVIVASPPCTEFSYVLSLAVARGSRGLGRPEEGMKLVREVYRIVEEAQPTYWCMENVRGAERYIGPPRGRNGPQSLWGNFPGFIATPTKKGLQLRRGGKDDHRDSRLRAFMPQPLVCAIAEACKP